MKKNQVKRIPEGYRTAPALVNQEEPVEASCSPFSTSAVQTGPGKIVLDTTSACDANTLALLFGGIYKDVNSMPEGRQKEDALLAAAGLEAEARGGTAAGKQSIENQFALLKETCPPAWETAVKTFIIPRPGVNPLLQLAAQRLKPPEL